MLYGIAVFQGFGERKKLLSLMDLARFISYISNGFQFEIFSVKK